MRPVGQAEPRRCNAERLTESILLLVRHDALHILSIDHSDNDALPVSYGNLGESASPGSS